MSAACGTGTFIFFASYSMAYPTFWVKGTQETRIQVEALTILILLYSDCLFNMFKKGKERGSPCFEGFRSAVEFRPATVVGCLGEKGLVQGKR